MSTLSFAQMQVKNSANQIVMHVDEQGMVGIGTTDPASKLQVIGRITANNITITTGAGNGKILSSNATGAASWIDPPTISDDWCLTGNGGTNPSTHFLGTTNAQPLVVRTNNSERMRILPSGSVGVNNTQPKARLSVFGDAGIVTQPGDWTGEDPYDPCRFGIHARLENSVRNVITQDAIRGSTSRPDGGPAGQENQFFSGVRGFSVTDNKATLLGQGMLGFSEIWDGTRTEAGIYGLIVQAQEIDHLSDQLVAVKATVLGNENTPLSPNTFAIHVTGAKSYFSHQIGVGIENPAEDRWIDVAGGAYCDIHGQWVSVSSREYKKDIQSLDAERAKSTLLELDPVTFYYKNDENQHIQVGFIAEEVPELVAVAGRKGMTAMDVTAIVTKVVQEQEKRIEQLEKEIKLLRNKIY